MRCITVIFLDTLVEIYLPQNHCLKHCVFFTQTHSLFCVCFFRQCVNSCHTYIINVCCLVNIGIIFCEILADTFTYVCCLRCLVSYCLAIFVLVLHSKHKHVCNFYDYCHGSMPSQCKTYKVSSEMFVGTFKDVMFKFAIPIWESMSLFRDH